MQVRYNLVVDNLPDTCIYCVEVIQRVLSVAYLPGVSIALQSRLDMMETLACCNSPFWNAALIKDELIKKKERASSEN